MRAVIAGYDRFMRSDARRIQPEDTTIKKVRNCSALTHILESPDGQSVLYHAESAAWRYFTLRPKTGSMIMPRPQTLLGGNVPAWAFISPRSGIGFMLVDQSGRFVDSDSSQALRRSRTPVSSKTST